MKNRNTKIDAVGNQDLSKKEEVDRLAIGAGGAGLAVGAGGVAAGYAMRGETPDSIEEDMTIQPDLSAPEFQDVADDGNASVPVGSEPVINTYSSHVTIHDEGELTEGDEGYTIEEYVESIEGQQEGEFSNVEEYVIVDGELVHPDEYDPIVCVYAGPTPWEEYDPEKEGEEWGQIDDGDSDFGGSDNNDYVDDIM